MWTLENQTSDVSTLGSTDMAHRFIIVPLTGRVAPSHLSSHPPFVDITRDDRAMSQNVIGLGLCPRLFVGFLIPTVSR